MSSDSSIERLVIDTRTPSSEYVVLDYKTAFAQRGDVFGDRAAVEGRRKLHFSANDLIFIAFVPREVNRAVRR